MAHRKHRPYEHAKYKAIELTARLRGGGAAADLTVEDDDDATLPSEIVTAVYAGSTGSFTIAFRHDYYRLLKAPVFSFVGPNGGMNGKCTAIDVQAGTATFLIANSTTPADPSTSDYIYVSWTVSNGSLVQ
jgi:hypothetical protein